MSLFATLYQLLFIPITIVTIGWMILYTRKMKKIYDDQFKS